MSNSRGARQGATDNPWLFLGFDLRQIPALWIAGWKEALSWPVLAWLRVSPAIKVHFSDGTSADFVNGRILAQKPGSSSNLNTAFHALVLPENILLKRTLHLPKMSPADLRRTLQFEVDAVTPFDPAQTVWGFRSDEHQEGSVQRVDLVLTSSAYIDKLIAQMTLPVDLAKLEIWGMNAQSQPVTLIGFAEHRRARFIRRQVIQIVSLLLLIPLLVIAIAGVPMVAAHVRLSHAEAALAALESQSSVAEAQRSKLNAQGQSAQVVLNYLENPPRPLFVLNLLSEHIPDSAYLERLDMNAQHVVIKGQADNAAALTQTLGALPDLQNVHAPAAITRNPQNNKERFTLEFTVNPESAHGKQAHGE